MKTTSAFLLILSFAIYSQAEKLEWCQNLPQPAYSTLTRVKADEKTAESWFEIYQIRPGVFAIYEPHQAEEVISYLILGADRAVLFDTGMGIGNIRTVVAALTKVPVSVINSHTHNDHIGDNWRFSDIYGMDTGFTRANAQGAKKDAQAELAPGEICGDLPAGFNARAYRTRAFHITHWLRDGEKIDLGGRTLQVIAAPGHTPDSIVLLDANNGLLFTGDTFYPGPIFLYRPETDLNAYVASLSKLAALAPQLRLLLPAHNVPVAPPGDLVRAAAAIRQVTRGQAKPVFKDGKREYVFDGFSFLLHP